MCSQIILGALDLFPRLCRNKRTERIWWCNGPNIYFQVVSGGGGAVMCRWTFSLARGDLLKGRTIVPCVDLGPWRFSS